MSLINCSMWEKMGWKEFQEASPDSANIQESATHKGYSQFPNLMQDLYSSLYQSNPQFPEQGIEGPQWHKNILNELHNSKEWSDLRKYGTNYDTLQSGLGANILSKHFLDALPKVEDAEDLKDQMNGLQDILGDEQDAERAGRIQDQINSVAKRIQQSEDAVGQVDPSMLRQAIRRSVESFTEQSKEMESATSAFGAGNETGKSTNLQNIKQKMQAAAHIKASPKLTKLAELAGRFKAEAMKTQFNKKRPGPDEITDIETGQDLGRVIPSELVKLGNQMTELDFCKRFIEGSLIQYRLDSKIEEQRGPVVVCIDNSGSMAGDREVWSKAIALALLTVATHQKRDFSIIHFDSDVTRVDNFSFNGGEVSIEHVLKSMEHFSGGGTNFDLPLSAALNLISNSKHLTKADVILITDGLCGLKAKDAHQGMKDKTSARLFTVLLQCEGGDKTDIEELSDQVVNVNDLSEDSEAKEMAFSL